MKRSARVISIDRSGKVQSVDSAGAHETRRRLDRLAWLLDSSIAIPGTRLTIGIDALLGLFPVLGDLLGVLVSSYIVNEARRLGAPKTVLLRMALNVGIEGVVGVVPLAGDVFDAAWKANQRNVRLLDDWLTRPAKTERTNLLLGISLVLVLASLFALIAAGGYLLVRWLMQTV